MSDATAAIPSWARWLITVAQVVLILASFSLGMAYQKFTSRFAWHEIPLKSGGIAFIVPEKWQVVTEWDKTGRPYIKPSDEATP